MNDAAKARKKEATRVAAALRRATGNLAPSEMPEARLARRLANKEKINAQALASYYRNKDSWSAEVLARNAEYKQQWFTENPGKQKEYSRKHGSTPTRVAQRKAYQVANPDRMNAYDAKRRASKLQATPAWANDVDIMAVYAAAVRRTKETGVPHEVDHIVPLQSPLVCGLHVAHNLAVVTRFENRSKSNRHWPNMPETK